MILTTEQGFSTDVEMQSQTPTAAGWDGEEKGETTTENVPSSAIITSDFTKLQQMYQA